MLHQCVFCRWQTTQITFQMIIQMSQEIICWIFKVYFSIENDRQTAHITKHLTSEISFIFRFFIEAPLSWRYFIKYLCFSVLRLISRCVRLFICALWSPARKRLTSWLSFVVSNFEFVVFPLVSLVRRGTWLYRFLIFAPLITYPRTDRSSRWLRAKASSHFLRLLNG